MKVVILCGGRGLRMGNADMPKPLMNIGERPILWHIMKHFCYYGFNEFILCLGYNGVKIRNYFYHYTFNQSDIEINTKTGRITHMSVERDDFNIVMADTGNHTPTGARIKLIRKYIDTDNFFVTYGDGVADVDIQSLLQFHLHHKKILTVTGIVPNSQFGVMEADCSNTVVKFGEKIKDQNLINGGFFVFSQKAFDYLDYDSMLEEAPMKRLVADKQLQVYKHDGFWSCMDTLKDMERLNNLWNTNQAPWKTWDKPLKLTFLSC